MITAEKSLSDIKCDALGLGWLSGMRLTAELSLIPNSVDMRRDWNFRLDNWADPEIELYRVALSSGEGERRFPALISLNGRQDVEVELFTRLEQIILPGQTSITLLRPPVAGSVEARGPGWPQEIDVSVDGRVVSLSEPLSTYTRVFYRPIMTLRLAEPWRMVERENLAEVDWSVVFEEQPA